MNHSIYEKGAVVLVVIIPFLLRIPLLFMGFGVEEDAWGHVLNAIEMKIDGHYIISRLPGHPAMELLSCLLLKSFGTKALLWNLPFALAGSWASLEFYRIARLHKMEAALWLTLCFNAVPSVLFAGATTMDYIFQLALILWAYRSMLKGKWWWVGIALGLAMSFRLTSALFALAIALQWTLRREWRFSNFSAIALPMALITVLAFWPAYQQLGSSFFSTYALPYPPLAKVFFKGSIGLLGPVGFVTVSVLLLRTFRKIPKEPMLPFWLGVILLHLLVFIRLPEKSAFLLPAIPFLFLMIGLNHEKSFLRNLSFLLLIGLFVGGINLNHPERGSSRSMVSVTKAISGQDISFDLLLGPYGGEWTKRQNKAAYVASVQKCRRQRQDSDEVLIAGWWYAMMQIDFWQEKGKLDESLVYYADEEKLEIALERGGELFALPEQEEVNHRKHGTDYLANRIRSYPCP